MKKGLSISAFAPPRMADYFRPAGSFHDVLASYAGLFENGRNAVYWAFRSLDLPPGTLVWMPAYHCGWEVHPLLDLGLNVACYPIREDLSLDEDFLMRNLAERPGAVYLIHYFGLGQPAAERLAAYCAEHKLPLIEDCAHALFSRVAGRELGTFGVMSIYSLAKTIAIRTGGSLGVDERIFQALTGKSFKPLPPLAPSRNYYVSACKRLVRTLLGSRLTGWIRTMRGTWEDDDASTCSHLTGLRGSHEQRYRDIYSRGLALPSRWLAGRVDINSVVELRRAHWRALDERLAAYPGYSNIFSELPPGVCPMFLVIRVRNRTGLRVRLKAMGIGTIIFGWFAHPLFASDNNPVHRALRENLLCLPIHQAMNDAQINYLAETVGPLLSAHAIKPVAVRECK